MGVMAATPRPAEGQLVRLWVASGRKVRTFAGDFSLSSSLSTQSQAVSGLCDLRLGECGRIL